MSGKPIDAAMRYQFETWARPKWRHREDFDQRIGAPHGTYNNIEVQAAWEAWQALTAAQQQGQAVACRWPSCECPNGTAECPKRTAPPPSAPVELAEAVRAFWRGYNGTAVGAGGRQQGRTAAGVAAVLSLAQQPAAVDRAATNSAVAAIQFALKDPEGMTFLRLWNEGEFDTLRREWPDAPVEVYIGADPLAAQHQEPKS